MTIPEDALKLLIVRKPVNGIPKGFIHVPHLSPSIELFTQTRTKWKYKLYSEEDKEYLLKCSDTINDESWWYLYKRGFIYELNERVDMKKALSKLERLIKQNQSIYLFCYCKNVCKCHRGLIGEYMKEKGYEVDFRMEKDIETPEESFTAQLTLFD